MLCFLTRLYHYEDSVLSKVEEDVDLTYVHKTFYKAFENAFCKSEAKVRREKERKSGVSGKRVVVT